MTEKLKPCPWCAAGETIIHVNKGTWTGNGYGEPVSVEVRHWCQAEQGQPSRMISRIGRDEASAIAAWNRRTEPAGSAEPVHVRADVRADVRVNDIDDRYAGRLAIMLECMLLDSNWYWSEAANLLDEYKAEWDKVNPQPPLFMAEPMPPERKALLLALKAERGAK